MSIQQQPRLLPACRGDEEQSAPTTSGPSLIFPPTFTDQLWKSMRLCPKSLACEKDFYLKSLRTRERARIVWKCVPAAGSNGRTGKNGKLKSKTNGQDRGGPLDSDGGNSRRGNTKAPVLKTRLKVICNEEKLAARHLVSGHSAASNTHQVMRESSDPGSPGNLHGSTKSSTPEDLSIQSNSVHRMVSNCSVGTMEVGVGASDKKASGGSLDKLSKDGSCALSQNGGQWSKEAGKVDNQAVKGTRTRKRGSDSSDRSVQGECQVELQPITIRRKLQRLVVKPLDRNSSISSPQRKDVEDSAEGHGQEGSALNDEELAMRLHHDLNAPSLRSRVRRSGANTSGLSRSGSLPDSARTSKTRSCPSRSGSRSFASDELHAE